MYECRTLLCLSRKWIERSRGLKGRREIPPLRLGHTRAQYLSICPPFTSQNKHLISVYHSHSLRCFQFNLFVCGHWFNIFIQILIMENLHVARTIVNSLSNPIPFQGGYKEHLRMMRLKYTMYSAQRFRSCKAQGRQVDLHD